MLENKMEGSSPWRSGSHQSNSRLTMGRVQLCEQEINILSSQATIIQSFQSQLLLISNDKISLHFNHQPLGPSPAHLT